MPVPLFSFSFNRCRLQNLTSPTRMSLFDCTPIKSLKSKNLNCLLRLIAQLHTPCEVEKVSETEPPTANWLQIQSRALSCAWQMSPTGSHDNSWMSWLDDFYSTERSGYNIDLSVAIKEGVGELELTESQLRAATAHWDHAVLNEVFSSKVNTKLDGLPAERVCLLMAEEFSQNQICEGHTLEGLGLQVVRDLAVEAVRSDAGFEPRLKKSFQLNSLIGQEVGSMLPVAGEVELVFESESLAEPHFMIESYSKIKAAEYEI